MWNFCKVFELYFECTKEVELGELRNPILKNTVVSCNKKNA